MGAVLVFKILGAGEWDAALRAGRIAPAPVDQADGFIHLSAADQLLETARRHFAGREGLVAVAFEAAELGDELRWEPSRGGALFPHLYADLLASKARAVRPLVLRPDGSFELGDELR